MVTIEQFRPDIRHLDNIDIPKGSINDVKQSLLIFGIDRKKPTQNRAVIILHQYQEKSLVLPCTSQEKQNNNNDFFELEHLNILWLKKPESRHHKKTYVFWQYENIDHEYIRKNSVQGYLSHEEKMRLLSWWGNRMAIEKRG